MKRFGVSDFIGLSDDEIEGALKAGYDPNVTISTPSFLRCSPLLVSILNRNIRVFKILLKYGADINNTDEYERTVLHYASHDRIDLLRIVLRHWFGVVDCFSKKNYTPLAEAILYNSYNSVCLLLDAGAKISNVKNIKIPYYITDLVQKRNQVKGRIVLFLALSKKTKAIHKDLLTTISKMIWELRDTEREEKKQSKKKFKK
jgi:ankyrin repeat protein